MIDLLLQSMRPSTLVRMWQDITDVFDSLMTDAEEVLARQIYAQLVSLVGNSEAERMTSDEVTT